MTSEDNVDFQSAQMHATLLEMAAVTDQLRRESEQLNAEVEAERAQLRVERERAVDEYAEQAREGEAGEARQELQRRIDKGETSWRDVMSAADQHWSAREVRDEIVGDARAEVDEIERRDPELAATYRQHADLRQSDRIGEWD